MTEKNYLKALKFFKKAYNCPEGKEDIDLILDLAFLYDKIANKRTDLIGPFSDSNVRNVSNNGGISWIKDFNGQISIWN